MLRYGLATMTSEIRSPLPAIVLQPISLGEVDVDVNRRDGRSEA